MQVCVVLDDGQPVSRSFVAFFRSPPSGVLPLPSVERRIMRAPHLVAEDEADSAATPESSNSMAGL